jgi:SnoaL-like domain
MPLTLDDKYAIEELVSRYNRAIDEGLPEEWAATFTDDGIFEGRKGRFAGREQLTKFIQDLVAQRGVRIRQHRTGNILIEGDGERARLYAYLTLLTSGEHGEPQIDLVASYSDELVKIGREWKFSHRRVEVWPAAAASHP